MLIEKHINEPITATIKIVLTEKIGKKTTTIIPAKI